jgi:hypothetical protein
MTAPVVACPYCTHDIRAAEFGPWTARPGLLSAPCECGRTVTMAAAALVRRTRAGLVGRVEDGGVTVEAEDYELACARLEWAQATTCLDLPAQREALNWHLACCEAAYARMHDTAVAEETS